jgi:hypothetical protein
MSIFSSQSVTKPQLKLSAQFSIVSAVLDIPLVGLGIAVEFMHSVMLTVLTAVVDLAYLFISVYVFIILRNLLINRFKFNKVTTYINIVVILNIIAVPLELLGMFDKSFLGLSLLLSLITGVIAIIFGVKLLKMKDDLYGFLKPFCYLTIIGGICGVTVILAPITTILGLVSDIILARMFFRAAKATK